MVRGCQKKIIYLKNTGSDLFDEAYFVVGNNGYTSELVEEDLVDEAKRILDECIAQDDTIDGWQKCKGYIKVKTLPFILGLVIGITFTILIK